MNLLENEYHPYYLPYINLTANDDIVEGLEYNLKHVVEFYNSIPAHKLDYAYAEGKWTIKDILLHCIDAERIFAYRALRISRQDKTNLAGFEQNGYVEAGKASDRSLERLLEEFTTTRKANISLFQSFSDKQMQSIGTASNSNVSVRALGYIITGHENHHINVIKERYL
ncbi:MAG: DinB family protein [Winogradskyella sp.]|uniref:DinB family protein n=1 Tax=Winogradskyella sp. TaxID=1883156 RepID=UPI000F3C9A21|nr:DinB family protein [Winogradskyella sp.]RNC87295.1 MAG: DinB family protein [Winogradskyella sp.]